MQQIGRGGGVATNFDAQLAAARVIEERVAELLRRAGIWVIPSYDWTGADGAKAPSVLAPRGWDDLVMPDLQTFHRGVQRWLEVKWKWWASYHRKLNQLETGISLRLYEHYRAIERVSGGDVYVLFVHHREGEMRGDSLKRLATYISHQYEGRLMGRDGMVFWPFEAIPRWGSLDTIELPFTASSAPAPALKTQSSASLKPPVKAPSLPQLSWNFNPRDYRYAK